MAYQRSRVLCAAARLGVADALKEGGVRSKKLLDGARLKLHPFIGCCEHLQPWASSPISAGSLCPHEPG
jgi:hypothetical protein